MSKVLAELESVVKLPPRERIGPLAALARRVMADANGSAGPLVSHLVEALESGEGGGRERMELGEVLGLMGDPRIASPDEDRYWIDVPGDKNMHIGRFPVTNAEYFAFVQEGGYDNRELWSEAGWEWLQSTPDPWPTHADKETSRVFTVANQPVVAVSWFEAQAYANRYQARLPRMDERVLIVRGAEKRPYPWGSPFGEGNANTQEEVLGRPCAVGLYVRDRTPEGVSDLAGNVAEWTSDELGVEYLVHPGAWDQPSLAAWAKAATMHPPKSRWTNLGFRLAK